MVKVQSDMFAEAKRCYPFEACGAILGKVGVEREAVEFVALQNRQNEVHAKDPKRYPRDAKTAYTIDAREWQQLEQDAKARGLKIISIFHSHPEHGVYFSAEDKEMAAPWGEPLFPDQSYIVVSVCSGEVKNASEFFWNDDKKDFIEKIML
ncbi:MAG: hypothetical protein ACD_73C00504G0001 [uncultured bacterium]|nr:MAG: hypothetical protein ACD_73C00504G0001 [uncultured bacterium]